MWRGSLGENRVRAAVLALLIFPFLGFIVLYSADAGCFICFDGQSRGEALERWVNLGLAFGLMLLCTTGIISKVRKKRGDRE